MASLLFDVDGTLIDSAPGIFAGMRTTLAGVGRPIDPDEDLTWAIGMPIRELVAKLLGDAADGEVEATIRTYRTYISEHGIKQASVYPAIPEVLAQLGGDHRLFVCTSKLGHFAERQLTALGIAGPFTKIYGAEAGGRFDDKGELIEHILASEGVDAADACMIGDRRHDVLAAARHAIPCVGVTWGYGSVAELEEAGAHVLCHETADLPAVLARVLDGSRAARA
ncbi:MAG TPA: HAD hydrolase-like protein [Phenylobacterium sp.]